LTRYKADDFGTTGNLFSQIAQFDIAMNQTNYHNTLQQAFELLTTQENFPTNFSDT
jgi:hypothetical protein